MYAYDETRRRAEEKKFRELIEKIRTSHKKKDNDALQTALENFATSLATNEVSTRVI